MPLGAIGKCAATVQKTCARTANSVSHLRLRRCALHQQNRRSNRSRCRHLPVGRAILAATRSAVIMTNAVAVASAQTVMPCAPRGVCTSITVPTSAAMTAHTAPMVAAATASAGRGATGSTVATRAVAHATFAHLQHLHLLPPPRRVPILPWQLSKLTAKPRSRCRA